MGTPPPYSPRSAVWATAAVASGAAVGAGRFAEPAADVSVGAVEPQATAAASATETVKVAIKRCVRKFYARSGTVRFPAQ